MGSIDEHRRKLKWQVLRDKSAVKRKVILLLWTFVFLIFSTFGQYNVNALDNHQAFNNTSMF